MKIDVRKTNDKAQIISLWKEAFGDEEKYISFFLNNCHNKCCYGAFSGDKLLSMLFLIDCKSNELNGKYIYAVATDKKYQKMGCMNALFSFVLNNVNCDFFCLVPAEKYLYNVYAKYGFKANLYNVISENCDLQIENLSYKKYFAKRMDLLKSFNSITICDTKYLYDENNFIGGSFYSVDNGIATKRYNKVCESICDNSYLSSLPCGMVLSDFDFPNSYFGLYLD